MKYYAYDEDLIRLYSNTCGEEREKAKKSIDEAIKKHKTRRLTYEIVDSKIRFTVPENFVPKEFIPKGYTFPDTMLSDDECEEFAAKLFSGALAEGKEAQLPLHRDNIKK